MVYKDYQNMKKRRNY